MMLSRAALVNMDGSVRGFSLFRQPLEHRDLRVESASKVHAPQRIDLFQRQLGLAAACVQGVIATSIAGGIDILRSGVHFHQHRRQVGVNDRVDRGHRTSSAW